jgi:hypothetical protein
MKRINDYADKIGGDSIKIPKLHNTGVSYDQTTEANIHVNIKIGPYSREEQTRVVNLERFTHLFVNTASKIAAKSSSPTPVFTLDELNHKLHVWTLAREEELTKKGFDNEEALVTNPKPMITDKIDIDYVRKNIKYLGVCNTESNAPVPGNLEKTISVITQGSTNIPNVFNNNCDIDTHWKLFFVFEEICCTTPQTYCYDRKKGNVPLAAPKSHILVRGRYYASKYANIPMYNTEEPYGLPESASVDDTYDDGGNLYDKAKGRLTQMYRITHDANVKEQAINKAHQEYQLDHGYTGVLDVDKYLTRMRYIIPFAQVRANDFIGTDQKWAQCNTDLTKYQRNNSLHVWMRATY